MTSCRAIPSRAAMLGADLEGTAARLAICVFCGSRPGRSPAISAAARELGELIGHRGHQLVYGAGGSGLMGELAWSASENGAPVTGYTPSFIYERELGIAAPRQALHITKDMFERKRLMIEHGDVFIALPGGYGTLDEILDVLSLTYLDVGAKPLILVNTENYWAGLVEIADSLHKAGFADRDSAALFRTARTPADAIAMAERAAQAGAYDRVEVAG